MKYSTMFLSVTFLYAGAVGLASAEDKSLGQQEYEASCAVCHGVDGKGEGVFTEFLKSGAPSLTTLSKNNGGVFPFDSVYNVIDGRNEKGHGTREMPIWGATYKAESLQKRGSYKTESTQDRGLFIGEWVAEEVARGRILALVSYISTFQEK